MIKTHKFYQNRGMYTETLVENTISWYINFDVGFFHKNHLPIKIKHNCHNQNIYGQITNKAGLDYCGVSKGKYYSFEVKETNNDVFLLSQLKKHQYYQMELSAHHGAVCFLLVNFLNADAIYLIKIEQIQALKMKKVRKITQAWAAQNTIHVPVVFPGVIDWMDALGANCPTPINLNLR